MNQFVTLSKDDSRFWPMLTGRFSKTHFAQPIKTLYVQSQDEQVTFKIVEKSQGSLLSSLGHWYSLARNIYLFFPIFGGLALFFSQHGFLRWDLAAGAFVSLQFFLLALTLYSDFHDYINGIDRINEHNFKKPLLRGLIRPYQVLDLAKVFLALAIVSSVYLFLHRPMAVMFAGAAFLISYLFSSSVFGQKFKGLTSVMSFLLAGPLLLLGLEYLMFAQLSELSALVGLIFGLHALKYDFCKQLRDVYYHSKARIRTLSTRIGFEKSKAMYSLLSLLHIGLLGVLVERSGNRYLIILALVAFAFEIYINRLLFKAPSFLSANINQCMGLQKLHYSVENLIFMFLCLSSLWI